MRSRICTRFTKNNRNSGMTLFEILITLSISAAVFIGVLAIFSHATSGSYKMLDRVATYGNIYTAESVVQNELSKAGPEIKYISLIRLTENGEKIIRGVRYSIFIPLTGTRITKQLCYDPSDERIKVTEKEFSPSDFSNTEQGSLIKDVSDMSMGGKTILSFPIENTDFRFLHYETRKLSYRITVISGQNDIKHDSFVFLINIR